MKKKDVAVVINARVKSSRVPNKLLRPFGDTCLLELALNKMLDNLNGYHCYLAAADEEIISLYNDKFRHSHIDLLVRTPESVAKGLNDYKVAWAHYEKIPKDYIMWINPCAPFVLFRTYWEAISCFRRCQTAKTMTSVVKHDNMFLDKDYTPVNFEVGSAVRTQMNNPIYEWSHLFHIFDKHYFLETGNFWDYSYNNPMYFEVPKEQSFDVDEPIDFAVAEALYMKYGTTLRREKHEEDSCSNM